MLIIENIRSQLDRSKFCAVVIVDLKKAFDTVDYEILLKEKCPIVELEEYGFGHILLKESNMLLLKIKY